MPDPIIDKIEVQWEALAGKYTTDALLVDSCFSEIRRKYSSGKRHYHNLHHIDALLQLSDQYKQLLKSKDVVDFSIFYHDIIYNVLRKDNETRSARVAVQRLTRLGVPADKIQTIQLFIEATKLHSISTGITNTADLELFLDFDMSILGSDYSKYEAYTRQVRKEYWIYPSKAYKKGRAQFLENCLASAHIFHSTVFRDGYEAKARHNIKKELELLQPE